MVEVVHFGRGRSLWYRVFIVVEGVHCGRGCSLW